MKRRRMPFYKGFCLLESWISKFSFILMLHECYKRLKGIDARGNSCKIQGFERQRLSMKVRECYSYVNY